MIKVDGRTFNVAVTEVNLDTEFMYKYAERTEDFNLRYELGAIFYNQEITFGVMDSNNKDFADLFRLLSSKSSIDAGTGHNVEIITPLGRMTFVMYPNKLSLKLLQEKGSRTFWTDFKVKFIATKPVSRW